MTEIQLILPVVPLVIFGVLMGAIFLNGFLANCLLAMLFIRKN